jgi:hypothetical protein
MRGFATRQVAIGVMPCTRKHVVRIRPMPDVFMDAETWRRPVQMQRGAMRFMRDPVRRRGLVRAERMCMAVRRDRNGLLPVKDVGLSDQTSYTT